MKARERIISAFKGNPDRTPLFEREVKSPSVREILGKPSAVDDFLYRMEFLEAGDWEGLIEEMAKDAIKVAEICGFDMVRLGLNIPRDYERPRKIGEYLWEVESGFIKYCPESDMDTFIPKRKRENEEEMRKWLREGEYQPPKMSDDQFEFFRRAKRRMRDRGLDLAIMCSLYTFPVAVLPPYMLEWFVTEPELLAEYYRRQALWTMEIGKRLIEEGADVIGIGGDLASDKGPLISPACYRRVLLPSVRMLSDYLHSLGVLVIHASDGNLWSIIDDFLLTSGVDGYEEIDKAAGMEIPLLKERFGDAITLVGNVDCRWLLTQGKPQEVKEAVKRCLDEGGGRRHILMTSNVIHSGVKPENFVAYLEAYKEYYGL
ncbi:MAG: uroporphyrinogen decarboxylase family protein [bacterium]